MGVGVKLLTFLVCIHGTYPFYKCYDLVFIMYITMLLFFLVFF